MMRKARSLTELIVEAEEVISDPVKNKKIHPAFLKRPRPVTAIYFSENYSKLQKQHPGMKNSGLMKIAIKQFKKLPDKKKAPYVDQFKNSFKEYTEKKLEIRKKYKISNRKCKKIKLDPKKTPAVELDKDDDCLPPKPPVSGYILFCKEMSEKEDVPKKSCVSEWSQRWRNLSEKERRAYITRCKELKNQYSTKLRDYLKGFEKDEQQQILHENKLKMPVMQKISNKTYKELLPGEPKKPSTCAYLSFWQEQMELLKEEIPNVRNRFAVVSKMWHKLSMKKKEQYKLKIQENLKKYSMELTEWFEMLTADEQEDYRKCNHHKLQFLDQMHVEVYDREELYLKQPSDSEDEATDNSSSDDEDKNVLDLNEEDDEEEEEEDDVMFEMYL
ncbi:nucleolar transcription factor 1-like isoform X2 [Archocentrus centrarchus]|uniref:nucleolar transcription factor 1-like isoform X2 n=1 Tax=Archocentrus centrarchus TaxID=63155 RepID=UPI0011E9B55C|nr:nucleolar transcription factor 1-like isoform X2 [Archocentrus centrarchus]